MEEILYVENNIILSRIEEELSVLDIEYFIKKTDISTLPSNLNKSIYAILFSDIKNKEKILEIYENIKMDQTIELESGQNNKSNDILKFIFVVIILTLLTGIIIFQHISYKNLINSINQPNNAYIYEYYKNGKEVHVIFKNNKNNVVKYFDDNKNGINEIIEENLPNGFVIISEDKNENGLFENEKTYKENKLIIESFSSKDNGIFDITNYYEDGIIKKTEYYNEETNEIIIK
jgi:hypothetical protein